jgi:hypothetical protein
MIRPVRVGKIQQNKDLKKGNNAAPLDWAVAGQ